MVHMWFCVFTHAPRFYGIDVSEDEIEKACGTTELGTTPTQISTGASKFGIDATAIKNGNDDDLKTSLDAGMPIIVLIDPSYIYGGIAGFGHFVVVVGVENGKIIYHDPGIPEGKFRRCEIERFLKAWSIFKNWMVSCKQKY
jgi:ABC-type bacteriocin/lantibiotic exporter with double-glycine peptidase domain